MRQSMSLEYKQVNIKALGSDVPSIVSIASSPRPKYRETEDSYGTYNNWES